MGPHCAGAGWGGLGGDAFWGKAVWLQAGPHTGDHWIKDKGKHRTMSAAPINGQLVPIVQLSLKWN